MKDHSHSITFNREAYDSFVEFFDGLSLLRALDGYTVYIKTDDGIEGDFVAAMDPVIYGSGSRDYFVCRPLDGKHDKKHIDIATIVNVHIY